MKLVVFQGMTLAICGGAVGLDATFILTRLMRSLLFGVNAADPATFGAISLLLALVALLEPIFPRETLHASIRFCACEPNNLDGRASLC